MKAKLTLLLFFFAVSLNSGFAQFRNFSKLDQFLDSLEAHEKFMGTILLATDGKVDYQRALGYSDLETGKKNTPETRLRIGSISKMFTTVLVLKTVEEGKLSLDQKLADFYPQIQNSDKITISQLLQHRSGIHNFTNNEDYLSYNTKPISEPDLVGIIVKGGSDFEPDSKADYSNSNFVLLTFILEKVNQTPFAQQLEEQIAKPLKLENTYVFSSTDLSKNESYSYNFNGKWVEETETDPSIPLGAGAISSTVSDLNIFIHSLFEGKLISEESLKLMMEIREGFGRGMFSFPYFERKSYGHTGGIDGFRSFLGYFPEEKVTITVLSNGLNYNNNDILLALLDTYFGKEISIPSFGTVVLSSEELDAYVGDYASEQIPLKLTFVKDGAKLIAKPSGQPETVLEATAVHTFEFKPVNAVFVFDPEKGEVILKQGGQSFTFKKQ
ncbi:MAG TPA: serine hydrolase domain-containing protein [Algoriphagus sp.]|nr:serine hydrolase domain-containing protein [Algoriphagus sp.]